MPWSLPVEAVEFWLLAADRKLVILCGWNGPVHVTGV